MRYYAEEHDCIDCFREEYYFLSNFYPAVIRFDGITYLNSEAAFQAQKCTESAERDRFSKLSADEAKKLGRKVVLRSDWNDVKIPLMQEIVKAKFTQNRYLSEWLLATGNKELIEGNTWHDTFWGVDIKTGEGQNHLGIILMELREQFITQGLPEESDASQISFGPIEHMSVVFGDITQADCMCIVNAANSSLLGGGGVDGAIHMAAGPELLVACRKLKGCKTGKAKITDGFNLKAKYIIHTVGPRYPMENHETLLRQAYQNSLDLAKEYHISSIAFPAISTGVYSYPKKDAVAIAVDSVHEWMINHPSYALEVVFFCIDIALFNLYCDYLSELS